MSRSFSSSSRFLQQHQTQAPLNKQNSVSCTELTEINQPEQSEVEDLDQRIVENYCDDSLQLEDSIEKLRKLLEQRQTERQPAETENLNYLR